MALDARQIPFDACIARGQCLHATQHSGIDKKAYFDTALFGEIEKHLAGLDQALVDRSRTTKEPFVILAVDENWNVLPAAHVGATIV